MQLLRKYFLPVLKLVLPLAVILWLVRSVEPAQWRELGARPKNWGMLSVAFALAITAVCVTFIRWYLLVVSLGMRFRLGDAFRLGFLGYLFNFVSAGSVGGDLFKAFFIAREQPGRRAEAVATVLIDRVIGMYALLLVASLAILIGGFQSTLPAYQAIRQMTLLLTVLGGIALAVTLMPGFTNGWLSRRLASLPYVGNVCERLFIAAHLYGHRKWLMGGIFGMSMLVHVMLAVSVYLIARALFGVVPPLVEHLVIVPLSMVAGAMPFTPSGLGSFEFAMDELFQVVSGTSSSQVSGVLIALVFRLVTIAIAAVGVVYYWTCRAKVAEVLDVAQAECHAP